MAATLFFQYLFITTIFIYIDILIHCNTPKCNHCELSVSYQNIFMLLIEILNRFNKN